tara:strand:- start:116 stop:259 length:144 start_codon:yes stop_codon:yes gene_type:complete
MDLGYGLVLGDTVGLGDGVALVVGVGSGDGCITLPGSSQLIIATVKT